MTTVEDILFHVKGLKADLEQLKADLAMRPAVWGLWDNKSREWAADQWSKTTPVLVFSTFQGALEVAMSELRHGVEWVPMPYEGPMVAAPSSKRPCHRPTQVEQRSPSPVRARHFPERKSVSNISTEIGWIITSPNQTRYDGPLLAIAAQDDDGYYIPRSGEETADGNTLYIETHPHDTSRVFISLWPAFFGFKLDGGDYVLEPREIGLNVRRYIKQLDPNANVYFGVIVTER